MEIPRNGSRLDVGRVELQELVQGHPGAQCGNAEVGQGQMQGTARSGLLVNL